MGRASWWWNGAWSLAHGAPRRDTAGLHASFFPERRRAARVRTKRKRGSTMAKYIPSPRDWVREQVELYESSGGTKGTTLRDTGLPVIIVTHTGNKTGAIRKTPLMRVKDGDGYVLVGSQGG